MEKRKKEMRASGVEVEHAELDDLLLDIQEQQQQAEAEAAEASEANNKKLDKERQEAEEQNSTVIDGAFIRNSEEKK